MFDLSGIARHLKTSVDQIRLAAELIEQGYSPVFIEQYRKDETHSLPRAVLQRLKFEIDRRKRIEAAKERAVKQLPKDSVLDAEAERSLAESHSSAAVDVAIRCFRARRGLEQSHERSGLAGKLLEAMLNYSGPPVEDLKSWVLAQFSSEVSDSSQPTANQTAPELRSVETAGIVDFDSAMSQVNRLVSAVMMADTNLNTKLRHYIQRNALLTVQELNAVAETGQSSSMEDTEHPVDATDEGYSEGSNSEVSDSEIDFESGDSGTEGTVSSNANGLQVELGVPSDSSGAQTSPLNADQATSENLESSTVEMLPVGNTPGEKSPSENSLNESKEAANPLPKAQPSSTVIGALKPAPRTSKPNSKLTPRQRRRRWLMSVLTSMKAIKKHLHKLTAYQQLMIGRGVRSQLVATQLTYDATALTELARNSFVESNHGMVDWFRKAAGHALEHGLRGKIESDAMFELEERAAENLLEHSTNDLRQQLLRRPVRGHTIALIDSIGPKTVVVVVVDPLGKVLACEELPCSAQPDIVSQSVVKLGEWVHKHRVTLVALTNGPARRFMQVTLRELMQQSKDSGLRWTMADRSGAEAYAVGRIGLRELSIYNRRQRAAIWAARCLQDPLVELLKVDVSRLRLGSYQRELPQEALRQMIHETLAECVCARGIDTQNASEDELKFIPGVHADQARQIAQLARNGQLKNRSQFQTEIAEWSDVDRRQSMGWLRVFGGTTPLDATQVHPEDYRLAERLIEHTELVEPPSAPPGWVKRKIAEAPVAQTPSSDNDKSQLSSTAPESPDDEAKEKIPDTVDSSSQGLAAEPNPERTTDSSSAINSPADMNSEGELDAEAWVPASSALADTVEFKTGISVDQTDTAKSDQPLKDPSETESVILNGSESNAAPEKEKEENDQAGQFLPAEYPEQTVESTRPAVSIDCDKLANQWQVGRAKLKMVADALTEPFLDPRLAGIPVPMQTEMPSLENLQPDMCVWAVVVGVADFGAFVELGPNCSGLIHISRLSTNFIEDPHQCVQIGDLLMTWVVNIDKKKNRVALTAISPQQRAQMQAEVEARKSSGEDNRFHADSNRHAGAHRDFRQSRDHRSGRTGQGESTSSQGTRPKTDAAGDTRGGARESSDHSQRRGGYSRHSEGRGQAGRSGGRRDNRSGRDRNSGQDSRSRHSKTVVVSSKQPKAPITQAMKEGEEPLRSFSDLLQFYESQRSGESRETLETTPAQTVITSTTSVTELADTATDSLPDPPASPSSDNPEGADSNRQ